MNYKIDLKEGVVIIKNGNRDYSQIIDYYKLTRDVDKFNNCSDMIVHLMEKDIIWENKEKFLSMVLDLSEIIDSKVDWESTKKYVINKFYNEGARIN
jgi:hypothetical protein